MYITHLYIILYIYYIHLYYSITHRYFALPTFQISSWKIGIGIAGKINYFGSV